jgi:AraC-like DNA-binding protein
MSPATPGQRLLRAKALMDTCYSDPLDVLSLAGAAQMSRAHFSREFHRTFGIPPHRYLTQRRMEHAVALLLTTDHTVSEICRMVGLQSVGSFTTRFGRTFGTSPAAYRAAHR